MKTFALLLHTSILLAGCLPVSRFQVRDGNANPRIMSRSPFSSLQQQIDKCVADSLFPPSNIGVKVLSLASGETLYELNPDMLFTPASNQKLFTAAAALSILGESYALNTQITIDTGDTPTIYISGFGDPLLVTADIDSISAALVNVLPPQSAWRLVGDVSYFDDRYWGSGWMWDDEPDPTAIFISPLSVNGNTATVRVQAGTREGDPLAVTTVPDTRFITIENNGRTVEDTVATPLTITRRWKERSNMVIIHGEMSVWDTGHTAAISVWDPAGYVVTLFKERLQSHGLEITETRLDTIPAPTKGFVAYSHRLDSVVTYMNKVSDNLSAESLLKILGAERWGTRGTAAAGVSVVKEFLANEQIDTTGIVIADGSGVSRYNLTSAGTIVALLRALYRSSAHSEVFINSLPVPGGPGSLSDRMKGFGVEASVRAKTGTLAGACALSGYVYTRDGEPLAFSILMQNYPRGTRTYRSVQDQIVNVLSRMTRSTL